jgi:hypothetical protein
VRRRAALAWGAAAALCAVSPRVCLAQLEASLDAGASYVKYDDFLGSAAASLTPSATYRTRRGSLGARGSILVFESGNTSLMGLIAGGLYSPPLGPARLELVGEGGSSAYARFARFQHAVGGVRAHVLGPRRGAWAGPVAGAIWVGDAPSDVSGFAVGAWSRLRPLGAVSVAVTRTVVGSTAYSDAEGRVRWQPRRVDVEATLGTRFASRHGGLGVYGDVAVTARLGGRTAVVIAAGRYPTDAVRGSIAGSFFTAALKLQPHPLPRTESVRALSWRVAEAALAEPPRTAPFMRLTVERLEGLLVLTVRAPGAELVELMGDFTGWQPIIMTTEDGTRFEFAIRLPPGVHRYNVRMNGGAWTVPSGADVADDEFGGRVGVLVVP